MDVAFIKTFNTTVGYGLTSVKKQISCVSDMPFS